MNLVMNFKTHLPLALIGIVSVVAGSMLPMAPAAAQSSDPTPILLLAQADDTTLAETFPNLAELNLTPEQEDQLIELALDTRAQLEAILTPEQQQQFQASLESGSGMRDAVLDLNLSLSQKRQIRPVMMSTRETWESILTPEQQALIQEEASGLVQDRMAQ